MEMASTSPPEARGRRGEIRVAIAHRFATLLRMVGPSRKDAAEAEVRSLESLFSEMERFVAGFEAAPSESLLALRCESQSAASGN